MDAGVRSTNAEVLRSVVESATDAIILIDEQSIVESINAPALRLFGYERDEVTGCNVSVLMPHPYRAEHDRHVQRYVATGVRGIIGTGREVDGRRKDGSVFPIHLWVVEIPTGERRVFAGIVHDLATATTRAALVERRRMGFASRAPRLPDPLRHILQANSLETPLKGVWGAPGVAVGTVVLPYPLANLETVPDRHVQDVETEVKAFKAAVASLREELRESGRQMGVGLPPEARALLDAYTMLLESEELISDVVQRIGQGNWAPGALRDAIYAHVSIFERMEDPYLQARAGDIADLGRRILSRLHPDSKVARPCPERCILAGDEVSVAQIADVPIEHLVGVVCTRGSGLSHIAILARTLGIPAVMGLGDLPLGRLDGSEIIVDGYQGQVHLTPSPIIREEFERLAREERELSAGLEELRSLPAHTPDGVTVHLHVNAGLLSDIPASLKCGSDGVGLYRTEFAFMAQGSFPGEEKQYEDYRKVLEAFAPWPVTMRILDIGGDKPLPYFHVEEDNPGMGWRGIRVMLDHPGLLRSQLRAMLRANEGLGNLHLLFPMVTSVSELRHAIDLLELVRGELIAEGQASLRPRLGVMIETPAAAFQLEALAERVDFLSVGTNDLAQYVLAVDRNNGRIAHMYDTAHPAVIRILQDVVQRGHQCGKPVCVCGEMAGDPAAALLLLGMRVEHLSMAAANVPRIKRVVRSFPHYKARELLDQALTMEDPHGIRRLLNRALEEVGLGGLLKAGK